MLRSAVRLLLVVIVLVAAMAFLLGYRWAVPRSIADRTVAPETSRPIATAGRDQDNHVEHARETGAAIGEKVAVGAERAGEALDDTAISAKIKSKLALDDTLKGSHVAVSTTEHVVTLSGTVENQEQHRRALALARETDKVADVRDQIGVGDH